jgi:Response regulators consisting of a CheY-like receiver domain and a winged-helix DNA-binding domain
VAGIVIVEDDEIVGAMVGDSLATRGHCVELVTSGDDALETIRECHPDLIVLDCALPGKSGLLVLKDLRESATFQSTPVLVMSARRSDWYVNLALNEGADDYVKKPFHPAEIVQRIETLLGRASYAF